MKKVKFLYYLMICCVFSDYGFTMESFNNEIEQDKRFAAKEKFYIAAINSADIEDKVYAHHELGILYEDQKKLTKAEEHYLIAMVNGSGDAPRSLNKLYYNQGKVEEAKVIVNGGKQLAFCKLGKLYQEQGKLEEAQHYYDMAIADGDRENALYNFFVLKYGQEKKENKLALYNTEMIKKLVSAALEQKNLKKENITLSNALDVMKQEMEALKLALQKAGIKKIEEKDVMKQEMEMMIPEVAKGNEKIYQRFLNGKLIYRPTEGSDEGKIELAIAALVNPLAGEFDLSKCDDAGKYLSINTGYRKGKRPENQNKVEIWFAPRFLVEKEINGTAKHFKGIMGSWPQEAPVGIIYTWGNWDDLSYYDYATTMKLDDIMKKNLYEIYYAAPAFRRPPNHMSPLISVVDGCKKFSCSYDELK